jgi:hypothetical protein
MSRIASFEVNGEYYEFTDLRLAKKEAKQFAKKLNHMVNLTHQLEPSHIQDWYYVYPDGNVTLNCHINLQN